MATNQDNMSTILSLEGRSVQLCGCTAPSHPTEKSKGRWGWNPAPLHSQVVTYSNSHRSCVFLTQNSSTVSFLFSIKSKLRTIVPKSLSNLVLSFWSPLGATSPFLSHCRHMGKCAVPGTHQAHSTLKAFALVIPAACQSHSSPSKIPSHQVRAQM